MWQGVAGLPDESVPHTTLPIASKGASEVEMVLEPRSRLTRIQHARAPKVPGQPLPQSPGRLAVPQWAPGANEANPAC